ncbi:MAG: phosphoribosylamine--glycine ligase [Chitinophagaceae bacterium]|jgi:phosphoribosylamine--glycine ligase
MNILLLGSGGREHAMAWKISQSKLCSQLYIAPGNPGTAKCGENVTIGVNDFETLAVFCKEKQIEMLVVGPEDPLVNGVYDYFKNDPSLSQIVVVGPSAKAAQLEGSKAFAKAFMDRNGIPTAQYKEFTKENYTEGIAYLREHSLPIVLKADGLAAGKGVVIAQSTEEAIATFEDMIQEARFGKASERVVVEQFLTGVELSVFALTDGKQYVLLPEAKDYKRIGEGDEGPNTGGMGAVSPVPFADAAFMGKVIQQVVKPTIDGLHKEGLVYKGFVFFGLINVAGEPFVIEYNCRMGDPETEVVMPRLRSDLVELMLKMEKGELEGAHVQMDERAAATVVLVSGGYPGDFEKGKKISGLSSAFNEGTHIFYAGIASKNDDVITSGGRVAAVTSYGNSIANAVASSIAAIDKIDFEGMAFRRDIGYEFKN